MVLLDGKNIAYTIRRELKQEVSAITQNGARAPHLAVVIVGNDPASETYVNNKLKACEEVGFRATKIALPVNIAEDELLRQVELLNADDSIDGFIVQLPLPPHINEQHITCAIDWRKDVDGLHPENVGRTALGLPGIVSATPRGIRELLLRYQIAVQGKHVVVIGRSNIVGKPMAMLLMQKHLGGNATVTLCHSYTQNLKEICLTADIIIVAVGHPGLLTADMVPNGATVIDVGISRVDDIAAPRGYRLCGDVDFPAVAPKCAYITPVPGGVGPMTIASLLQNTWQAYRYRQQNG
ncbi:MAG: bifunctional 5,10-methylenetetrahydrofolate dehydrogenase/5,10-methenyltetrahydrofolate cyclohydrolase [Paludibacter sp.]|nr:bifunctional 5,10-methylenetetrahydrofolate dehydrogenase/5,10-methenyltetrahydrofolate cyclohydrolase [Bacteroidales bacterium]MCM1068798.1 bifunctional 5,10-methylenetetrahydrofolate dehydrogenase/5,10-methenyltetrahydrofolate cyclohydrolase [Prevotella sp.]MCM1353939.1 bifunctional 5,10-methylenetetrahydrofolate dehydrogenase/5,10-methenyltetrahydrofolate cyclohydrolase [Bacteroides sp.]MCM1443337.1 bifunctional 5,10-methylenetetrahydrofolate dehydrogenase/5,10-methenyltetrahydrofolate cyc